MEAMDTIKSHIVSMFQGSYLIQRRQPLSEDGEILLRFVKILETDLANLSVALKASLGPLRQGDRPATVLAASALARQAYTFQYYVQGEMTFNEKFGREQEADRWRQKQQIGQVQVGQAHQFAEPLMAGAPGDAAFYRTLWSFVAGLPGIFRAQLADTRSVEAYRLGESSFAAMGLGAEDAQAWQAGGWQPYEAAEWDAHGFSPSEAADWGKAGFVAGHAGAWRSRGFDLQAATTHVANNVSPVAACQLLP